MKYIGLIILILSVLTSCRNNHSIGGYAVNAVIRNIPDSTKVVMYFYPKTEVVVDSTIIIGEKFQFIGKVERPRLAMLRIESTRDNKMFWLENQRIDIEGEKGFFNSSKVIGSKTQKEAELLLERKDSIFKEMKRIGRMVTDSNRDSLFSIYEKMEDIEIAINKRFIKDYPSSYESLVRLNLSMEKLGGKEAGKLLFILSKELQLTEEAESIEHFIKLNKNPEVGEKYIDFEQNNSNGSAVKLSDMMGKYTLLEFWSSSCGPCRAENPKLVKQYELYKNKGFVIVGISLDSEKGKWLKAIEADSLPWENVSDLKGSNNEAAMIYGVRSLPDNFLIDENGEIIARYIRGDNLKKKLKELFEDKASF